MKKIFLLLAAMLPSLAAFGYPEWFIYNTGTNQVRYIIWYSSNGDPGPSGAATGILNGGQMATNTDGACGNSLNGVSMNLRWGLSTGSATNQMTLGTFQNESCSMPYHVIGTFPIYAFGVPTNCTDTITISNPDNVDHTYQLLRAGVPSGTVSVSGGTSQTFQVPNPNCQPGQFSYYPLNNYWNLGPPGYSPANPGLPPGDNPPIAANSGTSNQGGASNGGTNSGPNGAIAPFTNNIAGANTNGPINFGTNAVNSPTNVANNGTIMQGDNALYKATVQSSQAIVDAIHAMDQANRQGHSGTSNLLQTVTNELGMATNLLGKIASNTVPNTNNLYGDGSANSTAANSAMASGATLLQHVGDSVATMPAPTVGSASFPLTINAGAELNFTYELNPLNNSAMFPAVATVAPWVRTLSQWGMTFWFCLWLIGEINQVIRLAGLAPQGQTAEVVPIVAEATSLVAAGVVVGTLIVLATAVTAYLTSDLIHAVLHHPFAGGGGSVVTNAIALLDAVFDITLCLSLAAQRMAIPFYLSKAYYVCIAVVRFATG